MASNLQNILRNAALDMIEAGDQHFPFNISDTDEGAPLQAITFTKAVLKITQDVIEKGLFEAGVDGVEFDLIERMDDVFGICLEEARARKEDKAFRHAAE